jgi:hypothetical protein
MEPPDTKNEESQPDLPEDEMISLSKGKARDAGRCIAIGIHKCEAAMGVQAEVLAYEQ